MLRYSLKTIQKKK